jgi:hypothetical protein
MRNDFGSKATSGLCQAIIALMPPHDTYIETHLGGGAIMQRKPPARRNIAIDVDLAPLARFECNYPVEKVHGCAHRFLREFDFHGRELLGTGSRRAAGSARVIALFCHPLRLPFGALRRAAGTSCWRGGVARSCR